MEASGKKILVAGANGLLGKEIVVSLLRSGLEVIATDINFSSLKDFVKAKEVSSSMLTSQKLDLTNEEDVRAYFSDLKGVTGAVNCSYPRNSRYGSSFYDVNMGSFNENISLNLGTAFLFSQQCAKYFARHQPQSFSLVNISSIYGVVAPKFDLYKGTKMTMPVEYAVIKSGLLHLNKYVAAYVNNSNFRVNSVSPGGLIDDQPPEFIEKYKLNTLGTGMLNAKDMCGAVQFLLSDAANYINGQNIIIDDGFTL
ncbi:MAG: SDR family oxidoreductase [Emcibacter sp.]|nr:SDR family oxidoreductase [Emcibacter sp.]